MLKTILKKTKNKKRRGRTLGQIVKTKLYRQNHTKKRTHTHSQKEKKEKKIIMASADPLVPPVLCTSATLDIFQVLNHIKFFSSLETVHLLFPLHSVQWPPTGSLVSLNFLENACCSQREQEGSEEMYHFF